MKLFKTAQNKDLDQHTIHNEPIESINLMERASKSFVEYFLSKINKTKRIIIFAGYGNNGGDALAIGRLLILNGYKVICYLFNTENKLSPDCEINRDRLVSLNDVYFFEITTSFSPPVLEENDVIIDGLFGSGLNKPLTGGYAAIVKLINQSKSIVYSIDIPSGLFGEDNSKNNEDTIIKADVTLTFQSPKISFLLPENDKYTGKWEILNINLNPDALINTPSPYYYTEHNDIISIIKSRSKFAHKGNFGHALIIAGSNGKMGAAFLSAKACLKSGIGLLTCQIPNCGYSILQTALPEAMLKTDTTDNHITEIPANLEQFNSIGVGPGIEQSPETLTALTSLLNTFRKPLVIDADALNLIAHNNNLKQLIPTNSILTPHPKEFDRLAGYSESPYERLNKAIELAEELNCYIILKGAYSATITPQKECWFNSTGNPGMATAGSGDVLTDILTGLLGQGYTSFESCLIGNYLHGLAGDLSLERESQESLIASNIIDNIGEAFKIIKQDKNSLLV